MFRTILRVERLGERSTPSAAIAPTASLNAAVVQNHDALTGIGQGHFATTTLMGDMGAQYHVAGSGQFALLGAVVIDGSLGGVGFIQHGYAHGSLTFTNEKGSVTLGLTAVTAQNAFAPLPNYFRYTITGGTGAYAHLQEHGTVRIDFTPPPSATHPQGTFRIAI